MSSDNNNNQIPDQNNTLSQQHHGTQRRERTTRENEVASKPPSSTASAGQRDLASKLQSVAKSALDDYQGHMRQQQQNEEHQSQPQQQPPSWFNEIQDYLKEVTRDVNDPSRADKKKYAALFGDFQFDSSDENLLLGFVLHNWCDNDAPNGLFIDEKDKSNEEKNRRNAVNSLSILFHNLSGTKIQIAQAGNFVPRLLKEIINIKKPPARQDKKTIRDFFTSQTNENFSIFGIHYVILPKNHSLSTRKIKMPGNAVLVPSPSLETVLSDGDLVACRVLIIGGSSGSGKTILAFHAAKRANGESDVSDKNNWNIVIYLTGTDIAWTASDESDFGTSVVKPILAQHEKDERNNKVQQVLINAVDKLVSFSTIMPDKEEGSNYRVSIIIDEAGEIPVFVRGLCASVKPLGVQLHEKFFGEDIRPLVPAGEEGIDHTIGDDDFHKKCRIRFIVAGTGLAVKKSENAYGSMNDSYHSLLLDDTPLPFEQVVKCYFPDEKDRKRPEVQRLLLLDSKPELKGTAPPPPFSQSELIASALVKNARCAALLLLRFREDWIYYGGAASDARATFSGFTGVYDEFLTGLLPRVVRGYIDKCGLSRFSEPTNLLLAGLAVAVFDLPQLPDSPELANELFALRTEPKRPVKPSVFHALCVRGGILVDTSLSADQIKASEMQHYVRRAGDRFSLKTGRYRFSPAHVAMVQILFNLPRRPISPTGLEFTVSDFCTLVVACAPFYRKLKTALEQQSGDQNVAADSSPMNILVGTAANNQQHDNDDNDDEEADDDENDAAEVKEAAANHADDPLYCLKLALDFGLDPHNMSVLYKHSQERLAMEDPAHSRVSLDDRLRALHSPDYCGSVRFGNQVVVLLNAHEEPFADVVILGPNKLILIQVKSRRDHKYKNSSTKVTFAEELAKMGLKTHKTSDDKTFPTGPQNQFLAKLINLCRVDGGNTPVKVKAFVLIEADGAAAVKEHGDKEKSSGPKTAGNKGQKMKAETICLTVPSPPNLWFPAPAPREGIDAKRCLPHNSLAGFFRGAVQQQHKNRNNNNNNNNK